MTSRPLVWSLATVLLLSACSSGTDGTAEPTPPASTAPTEAVTEPGNRPVAAEPQVEVEGDCTPEPLQDDDGRYVSADLEVTNTGNIGTRARINVVWPAKGSRLVKTRFVRLRPGRSRSVSVRLALTQADADAITTAVGNDRTCRINSRVVGAFGAPVED